VSAIHANESQTDIQAVMTKDDSVHEEILEGDTKEMPGPTYYINSLTPNPTVARLAIPGLGAKGFNGSTPSLS
jgi:hypothetical protein